MLRTLSLLTLVVLVLRVEAAPPESQVAPTPRLKPIQKLEPPPHIEPRAKIVDPPLNLKLTDEFEGRNYRGKPFLELSRYFGSNEETERATARGLAWLARQQKLEGNWLFDGSSSTDTIAATGMSLLPYLGTGQTHKKSPKYSKTVERGLTYLIAKQKADGSFETAGFTMYTQGIATIALCEAYAMTKDRDLLLKPAQKAIDFIVKSQGENGSWGYQPGTRGDTSILGWNVQALYAAILSKDIVVPKGTIKKASAFLDEVSSGEKKSIFGYAKANGSPGTSLSAVGLMTRIEHDGWTDKNASLVVGIDGLFKREPQRAPAKPDMYFYYYATRAAFYRGGDRWKDWNLGQEQNGKRSGGIRDWLVSLQIKKEGPDFGSWEPDGAIIGGSCGRLGTTALSILTLEVYYRYVPRNHPDIKVPGR